MISFIFLNIPKAACGISANGWGISEVPSKARNLDEALAKLDMHMLGWSYNWSLNGDHGLYRAHAGALYFDDADFGDRREMQGCIMKFPIYVEAVLLVNSSHIDNTLPCTILRNAFDASWVN